MAPKTGPRTSKSKSQSKSKSSRASARPSSRGGGLRREGHGRFRYRFRPPRRNPWATWWVPTLEHRGRRGPAALAARACSRRDILGAAFPSLDASLEGRECSSTASARRHRRPGGPFADRKARVTTHSATSDRIRDRSARVTPHLASPVRISDRESGVTCHLGRCETIRSRISRSEPSPRPM